MGKSVQKEYFIAYKLEGENEIRASSLVKTSRDNVFQFTNSFVYHYSSPDDSELLELYDIFIKCIENDGSYEEDGAVYFIESDSNKIQETFILEFIKTISTEHTIVEGTGWEWENE